MSDPSTTNYGFVKATVGGDDDAWGDITNTNLDLIDTAIKAVANSVPATSAISSSLANVASSLTNVSSSLTNVSSSLAGVKTSVSQISSSLSGVSSSLAGVSTSLVGVSSSLANNTTSLVGVSTSLAALPQAGTTPGSAGTLGIVQTTQATNRALTAADWGTEVFCTANITITIPSNASVAAQNGSWAQVTADAGKVVTLAISSDTLRNEATNTTGSITVTGPGHAIASKKKSTEWWGSGVNVT